MQAAIVQEPVLAQGAAAALVPAFAVAGAAAVVAVVSAAVDAVAVQVGCFALALYSVVGYFVLVVAFELAE